MNREEFINELRMALAGELSSQAVDGHARYYERYIIEETGKGRYESEILEELGDPRLIAKTIIDTQPAGPDGSGYEQEQTEQPRHKTVKVSMNSTFQMIGVLLIFAFILIFVGRIVAVFFPVIVVLIVISLIRRSGRR